MTPITWFEDRIWHEDKEDYYWELQAYYDDGHSEDYGDFLFELHADYHTRLVYEVTDEVGLPRHLVEWCNGQSIETCMWYLEGLLIIYNEDYKLLRSVPVDEAICLAKLSVRY